MTPEQIIDHFVEIGREIRKAKPGDAGCVVAVKPLPRGLAKVWLLVGPDSFEADAAKTLDPSWKLAFLIVDAAETANNLGGGFSKVVVVPSKVSRPVFGKILLTLLRVAVPLTPKQRDILAAYEAASAADADARAAADAPALADAAAEAVKSAVEAAFASPAPAPGAVERHH